MPHVGKPLVAQRVLGCNGDSCPPCVGGTLRNSLLDKQVSVFNVELGQSERSFVAVANRCCEWVPPSRASACERISPMSVLPKSVYSWTCVPLLDIVGALV